MKGSHRRGHCEHCDYDLSDILGIGICPECGIRFDRRQPTERPLLRQSRFGQTIGALGIGCPIVLVFGSAAYRWGGMFALGFSRDAVIVALIGAYFAAVLALLIVVLWMSLLPSSERPRLGWIAGLLVGGVGVSWVVLAMK